MTTSITLSADKYRALLAERECLAQQMRVRTVERDWLERMPTCADSSRANPAQRDLFPNEAEALVPTGAPVDFEPPPKTSGSVV